MTDKLLNEEEHKNRHRKLHAMLDELVADYITHTSKRLTNSTVMDLIQWSAEQTQTPKEAKDAAQATC